MDTTAQSRLKKRTERRILILPSGAKRLERQFGKLQALQQGLGLAGAHARSAVAILRQGPDILGMPRTPRLVGPSAWSANARKKLTEGMSWSSVSYHAGYNPPKLSVSDSTVQNRRVLISDSH